MTQLQTRPDLYGADPSPGIVGLTALGERVTLTRAGQTGARTRSDERFRPFLLLAEPQSLGATARSAELERLHGPGALSWRATFLTWREMHVAVAELRRHAASRRAHPATHHLAIGNPAVQYLVASGRTFAKALELGELRRLALDIETYSSTPEFPSAARPGDCIIAVSLRASDGREELLWGKDLAEPALIARLGEIIRDWDPDVIEGHNLARFDLPYLETRARRYGQRLIWGRGGEAAERRPARIDLAERHVDTWHWTVPGRAVIDTWILAQLFDLGGRSLPGYGLKVLARHFGIAAEGRTYVAGERISWAWDHEPDTLARYALDDARETSALAALFLPPYLAQARAVPMPLGDVAVRGSASKIDLLLLREYLRQGEALPAPSAASAEVLGGYTRVFRHGVFGPVLHVDVASLYPSIMLSSGRAPETDRLGVFLELLGALTEIRLAAKSRGAALPVGPEKSAAEAEAQAFKLLVNSFYGYLGTGFARFRDVPLAAEVTARGRELLGNMVQWLQENDADPIEIDTDGIFFVPPPAVRADEAAQDRLVADLAATLPAGIRLELAGRYPRMLSYKAKNYALARADGSILVRGSALRSRVLEPYLRRFVREALSDLLAGNGENVWTRYRDLRAALLAHLVPVAELARTVVLSGDLVEYRQDRDGGRRSASAPYELALASGRAYRAGDQLSYYVAAGRGALHARVRLLSQWRASNPDEHTAHYMEKLRRTAMRLRDLLPAPDADLTELRPAAAIESDAQSRLF